MSDPTFNILIKIREDLAGLNKTVAGMQQLNAAAKAGTGVLDQYGRPLQNIAKGTVAADAGLSQLRRGAGAATQTMTGLLGATQALPPGFSAAASGVQGLLGSLAAGFGPAGIAVAAVSLIAGLGVTIYQQLVPSAEEAAAALKAGADEAERLGKVQMDALKTSLTEIESKATSTVAKLREALGLQAEVSGAERGARVAQITAAPGISPGLRASAITAENIAAKTEELRATVLLAQTEATSRAQTAQALREQEEQKRRLADAAADEQVRLEEQLRLYKEMQGLRALVLLDSANASGEDTRRYFELSRRPELRDQEGLAAIEARGRAERQNKELTDQFLLAQTARIAAEKEAAEAAQRHSDIAAAAARIQTAAQAQATAQLVVQTAAEQ